MSKRKTTNTVKNPALVVKIASWILILFLIYFLPILIGFAGQAEAAGWQIASSEVHTVVVKEDGTLWAWGSYKYGQLGDGTDGMDSELPDAELIRTRPTQIGTDDDWKAVAVGHFYTIALKEDGTLWAWGSNMYGQHGDGTDGRGTTPYVHNIKNTPTKIGTDEDWAAIWAGEYHTIALKEDGTLWAWGANSSGQLGLGHTGVANVPTQVGTDDKWISVSAGNIHTVALKSDHTLWAWGDNYFGQIGAGLPPSTVASPTQVGTEEWVTAAAGDYHTVAQKTDGKLWAWGRNTAGQLGVGYFSDKFAFLNEPILVTGSNDNSNWAALDAGVHFTIALKSDGTFWAWGTNYYGQHGDGNYFTDKKHTPTQIFDSSSGWVAIESGSTSNSTFALKEDGTLWAWGSNFRGQLGDGTTNDRHIPVLIYFPNSNANLSSLNLSIGNLTPPFEPDTTVYTVAVAYEVATIDVTATLSDNNASLTIAGFEASSGEPESVALNPAGTGTVIEIVVTASDFVSQRTYTIPVKRATFSDVPPDHPFFEEIEKLASLGIATGYPDGTFRPTLAVTRQAMAALLYRALEMEDPGVTEPTFSDVPTSHTFFVEIEALAASGITTSWPDGTFRPKLVVTRQAVAAFLFRAFELEDPGVTEPTFSDVSTDHLFFVEIEALAANGITTGWPDGTFRPNLAVTRQAVAVFLFRALELDDQ